MADLDDFFAKKDRKKAKGKKFMTTEEIAKKLEETGKKSDKIKKDKPLIQSSINVQEGDDLSEDEWRNFEEEKKDYSGLKIQNLTLEEFSDSENNDGESDKFMEDNGSGEMLVKKKGPWKVIEVEQTSNVNLTNAAAGGAGGGGSGSGSGSSTGTGAGAGASTGAATGASTGAGTGSGSSGTTPNLYPQTYVPPHMRNQPLVNRQRPLRLKTGAPDINSQEFFPTLSAAKVEGGPNWSKKKQDGTFEEVRNSRSHSNRSDPSHRQQNLQIGNKFGALESEHS